MANARMLPGFGMVVEQATKARMLPGAGMVAETVSVATGTNRLLLINPPGLNGGFASGGLSL